MNNDWPTGGNENLNFSAVLDAACERIWDQKIRYSLRRIAELEGNLDTLEQELDVFLHAPENKE
ncbi:hypothetical protein FACS1894151_03060 [Spirochaetia bacterium]|nr:hypothetical protein FACS1894151_03060 [Spirochaetia bacterium]